MFQALAKYFFRGLLVVVPVAATLYVVYVVIFGPRLLPGVAKGSSPVQCAAPKQSPVHAATPCLKRCTHALRIIGQGVPSCHKHTASALSHPESIDA